MPARAKTSTQRNRAGAGGGGATRQAAAGRGDVKAAARRLTDAGVEAVGLAFVDPSGVTRVKVVPASRFEDAARSGIGLSYVFSVFLSNDDITSDR